MQTEDQKAGPFVSGLVLIAAVLFTANVYMAYSAEKNALVYDEAAYTYEQAASVLMSLKNKEVGQASTTPETSEVEEEVVLQ